ncbi:hypothetical protein V2J09_001089 [Rumex salicifolius]
MEGLEFSIAELPRLYLVSAFLAMEPPDCLISLAKQALLSLEFFINLDPRRRECTGGSVTEEIQKFIWEHCIIKSGEKCQPLYLKNFLKKLIREVESAGDVVLDEFYEQYADYTTSIKFTVLGCIVSVEISEALCYSSSKRLVVPLQCSSNILEGDTGCAIWPSSLFLSEFILSFPGLFKSRSCFEVGSGVGLVGICLSHVKASKVIMSDGDLSSLSNLKLNLEMNRPSMRQRAEEDTNVVECIHLPWDSAKVSELQSLKPDIILGADVIYNPSCLPDLIRVLSIILKQRKPLSPQTQQTTKQFPPLGRCINKKKIDASNTVYTNKTSPVEPVMKLLSHELDLGPVALIATVIRNTETFDYFVSLASQANLVVRDLTETIKPAQLLPYMKSYPRSDAQMVDRASSSQSTT